MRYEDRLRALGAYVDVGNWRALRLFEVTDRVLLQGQSPADGSLVERWLAEEDVATLFSRLARGRTRGGGWREAGHVPGAVDDSPPLTLLGRLRRHSAPLPNRLGTTYEDVLRALGHLVDQACWYDLRLFELETGLLLQGRPCSVPDALVLASREFSDADLGELLRASYARRRVPAAARLRATLPLSQPPAGSPRAPMPILQPTMAHA